MTFQQYAHFPTIFIAIFLALSPHLHKSFCFTHARAYTIMYVVHNDAMTNDMLCKSHFLIFFLSLCCLKSTMQ